MDIQMPGVDGLEATQRIWKLERSEWRKPCRIVAVTADILTTDRTGSLSAGMDGYIAKPIHLPDTGDLIQQLRSATGQSRITVCSAQSRGPAIDRDC